MVLTRAPPVCVVATACAPLGPHSLKAEAARPDDPARAVKRKNIGSHLSLDDDVRAAGGGGRRARGHAAAQGKFAIVRRGQVSQSNISRAAPSVVSGSS